MTRCGQYSNQWRGYRKPAMEFKTRSSFGIRPKSDICVWALHQPFCLWPCCFLFFVIDDWETENCIQITKKKQTLTEEWLPESQKHHTPKGIYIIEAWVIQHTDSVPIGNGARRLCAVGSGLGLSRAKESGGWVNVFPTICRALLIDKHDLHSLS